MKKTLADLQAEINAYFVVQRKRNGELSFFDKSCEDLFIASRGSASHIKALHKEIIETVEETFPLQLRQEFYKTAQTSPSHSDTSTLLDLLSESRIQSDQQFRDVMAALDRALQEKTLNEQQIRSRNTELARYEQVCRSKVRRNLRGSGSRPHQSE